MKSQVYAPNDAGPDRRRTIEARGGTRKARLSRTTHVAIFSVGAAFCLTPWASPAIALALGMALALTLGNPARRLSSLCSKYLLQASVVLLGFGMNLGVVLAAGKNGLVFAAATIVSTFILGYALAVWLRIDRKTSTLISAGTAICGGSAIAAVGSSVDADHGEMTVAMGTVFLLNAVALYTFPVIGHALHMSQSQFGTWAGVAIHDISSVVGAASAYGLDALHTATAVKLSRALWILPVATAATLIFRLPRRRGLANTNIGFTVEESRDAASGETGKSRKIHIPWFIGLFLLASVARSLSPQVAAISPVLSRLAEIGLTLTLFMIGACLSRQTLKAVGVRPLIQGVILWIAVSTGALFVVLKVVH
ncbi:MAG: YeiH family protein [Gammaproteobacteria bacterium]